MLTLTLSAEQTRSYAQEPSSYTIQQAHRAIDAEARTLAEADRDVDGYGACEICDEYGCVIRVVYYGEAQS